MTRPPGPPVPRAAESPLLPHILSMRDFSRADLDAFLDLAEAMERRPPAGLLKGKLLANLFFEPSTRTRLSFEAAMKRLGGDVLTLDAAEVTSMAKGETLSDTIRVIGAYADAIVLRHPREGAARMAAAISKVPIINAGDGAGQHPTQTLLDLYTLRRESRLRGLRIGLVGDLRYARTVHSLAYALALYRAHLFLVSPEPLRMPREVLRDVRAAGARAEEAVSLQRVLSRLDALYVTRIQKERFPDPEEYRKVAGSYRLSPESLRGAPRRLIVLHPLPRVDEVDPALDDSPHARYFHQAAYGVPVRMAVLARVLGAESGRA